MDIQVFKMALTSYFNDGDKNIHNLMEYSKINVGILEWDDVIESASLATIDLKSILC